jgi:glycolate oxidase iron-sulfur subunit
VSALARDLAEVVAAENLAALPRPAVVTRRIAFHAPCTLQHGERLGGMVEGILRALGFDLAPVADPEQCCGAAGSYMLLNPGWADRLAARKLDTLTRGAPELIATANIGCQVHLQARTPLPVRHWIELLDARIDPLRTAPGSRSPDL